jgi:dipeptidyl aminopeptidase/acylaminoacyl peptidase
MTPPALMVWRIGRGEPQRITEWNPEFASLSWGEDRVFQWQGADGTNYEGSYILPPDHKVGQRYPLVVILDATGPTEFTARAYTTSAFPPQALANHGIAVLTTRHRVNEGTAKVPGNMREAYNGMMRAESGIAALAKMGIVDRSRVGLMGFSRTSWLADFIATQSSFSYRAISSCDSGIYNYASYFMGDDDYRAAVDPQYGATPFTTEGMKLYRRYAPSFNAHKVRAPVLLQYHGIAGPVSAMEYLGALRGHNKPVELMWFPDGEHNLVRPTERVASLQANVDWFRFWLKDEEDADPAKAAQYARWRKLRAGHCESFRPPLSTTVAAPTDKGAARLYCAQRR